MSRILHVSAVDFTASKLLRPQLTALAEVGYQVRLACGQTDPDHWDELKDFHPVDIPFPRRLQPSAMLVANRRLGDLVKEWRPDILHLHTPAASLPVRAFPHPTWPSRTRIVYTVHGYLHTWPPQGSKAQAIQKIEKWASRRTHLTLYQSLEDYQQATKLEYSGPLRFLGNGVEDMWFDLPSPVRREPFSILFVGRLVREKGIIELLQAVRSIRDVELHIAGASLASDRDGVETNIRELLGEEPLKSRVTMHGMLSRRDLAHLMTRTDALCLPSHREGVPRSVIEGLAGGRPVIATNIRGSRELVRDRVNGYLVPVGDVARLRQAIGEMRDLADIDFARMSMAARESVDPERRERMVFRRLLELYQELGVVP